MLQEHNSIAQSSNCVSTFVSAKYCCSEFAALSVVVRILFNLY